MRGITISIYSHKRRVLKVHDIMLKKIKKDIYMRIKLILILLNMLFMSACAEAPSLTIHFDTNGSEILIPEIIYDNNAFQLPDPPVKDNYMFDGWFLDNQTFLIPLNLNTLSIDETSHITVYAKWVPITYQIIHKIYEDITEATYNQGGFHKVSLGEFHSAAITPSGHLWTWGNNDYGQSGHYEIIPTNITNQFTLKDDEKLNKVFLGWEHTAVLTTHHDVYMFGRNDGGQLGINSRINTQQPTNITDNFSLFQDEVIYEMALGWGHSLALTSSGRLFSWGKNDSGQLGNGSNQPSQIPIDITSRLRLQANDRIISIAAGSSHSALLTIEGRLFMWGRNVYGQLGDRSNSSKNTPIDITSNFNLMPTETISSVALGWGHSIALTSFGRLFTWGYNGFGQLGDNTLLDQNQPVDITRFIQLNENETITNIKLGSSHTLIETSINRYFVWGWNQYGQLGIGHNENQHIPIEFHSNTSSNIKDVYLGVYHSAMLLDNGYLYLYGYNNEGQLGQLGLQQSSEPISIAIYKLYSMDTITIEAASFPYTLMMPSKEDYTFIGWFEDRSFSNDPISSLIHKKNDIIYGIYRKNT